MLDRQSPTAAVGDFWKQVLIPLKRKFLRCFIGNANFFPRGGCELHAKWFGPRLGLGRCFLYRALQSEGRGGESGFVPLSGTSSLGPPDTLYVRTLCRCPPSPCLLPTAYSRSLLKHFTGAPTSLLCYTFAHRFSHTKAFTLAFILLMTCGRWSKCYPSPWYGRGHWVNKEMCGLSQQMPHVSADLAPDEATSSAVCCRPPFPGCVIL